MGRRWRPVGRTRGSLAEIATRARPTIQIHGPLKKAGIRTAPGRAQVGLQFRAPERPDPSPNYKSQQEWGMGQDLGSEVERMGTPQRTSTHTHTHTETHRHTHTRHTQRHTHTHRDTHTHTPAYARLACWSRLYELQIPAGSGRGGGTSRGRCSRPEVNVRRVSGMVGSPGFRWGYPLPRVKEVPSLPEARLRVPAHAAPPWGSPTRAVLRDPEPHPPDPAGASGEADGGWALRPAALGRRVCLLNPLSSAWSELPFPGGRRSPDPVAGLSLLGISVWPAHLVEQPREGQGSPSSGM